MFNGQQSVLWNNLRNAFFPEIRSMYQAMRTNNKFSYAAVEKRFEDHQKVWCENMFNEDGIFKYIDPLINGAQDPDDPSKTKKTSTYLKMLQGSKAEQRKWWLWNRFKYMDSKYLADASNIIDMRGYAKGNITVIPYTDIYPTVKFGSYVAQERGAANRPCTLICMADNLNDTEVQIFSASQIKEVSDLTRLKIGRCDFSKATKLQNITIHDDIYPNNTLNHIALGNNELLQTIICKNAPNLKEAIDLSHCPSLKNVNFADTGITGVVLADGSTIETLNIPNTIATISFISNLNLSDLTIGPFSIDDSFEDNNFTILVVKTDTLYGKKVTVTNDSDETITASTTFENYGEKNSVIFIISELGEYTVECFGETTSVTIDSLSQVEYETTLDGDIAYIDFMADFGNTLLERVEATKYTGTAVYTGETPITSRYETGEYIFLGWNTERRATIPLENAVGREFVHPQDHMVVYPVIIGNDEFTTDIFSVIANSGKMSGLGLLTETWIAKFLREGLLQVNGVKHINKDTNGVTFTDYRSVSNINQSKSEWLASDLSATSFNEDIQSFNLIDRVSENTISSCGQGIYIGYVAEGSEHKQFGDILYINHFADKDEHLLYSYKNKPNPFDFLNLSLAWDSVRTKTITVTGLNNVTEETTYIQKIDFVEHQQLVKYIKNVTGFITITDEEGSTSTINSLEYDDGEGKTLSVITMSDTDYITIKYSGDWTKDSITLNITAQLYPSVNNMTNDQILAKASKISWSTGTDYELKKMVEWNDEGILDLYDYWNVGDKRNVPMVESRTGCFTEAEETQKGMTGVFVLVHQGSKTLTDGGTNKFVVNMDNLLLSARGISANYARSTAKTWMDSDDGFISMLPEIFASIFKRFTATNTAGGNVDVRFVYPTSSELYSTYTYYTQNTANRKKYVGNDPAAFGRYRCRNARSGYHDTIFPNGSNSDYAYNSTACYITAEGVI